METLTRLFARNHHVVTTRQFAEAGYASHHLTALVRSGAITRIRNGWYAGSRADPCVVASIRVGGRLAGISAAAWHGLATPETYPLNVHVSPNAARLRSASSRVTRLADDPRSNVIVHWNAVAQPDEESRLALSLHDCLRQVVLTESEDDAVACLDSALRNGRVDRIDLELLRASLPKRCRKIIDLTDGRSDGYPESVIRRRLARAGIATRIQVRVLDERCIDLLIGDRLALEIDGLGKYLEDPTPLAIARKFAEEKKRDAFLVALGFVVIHITYEMLMDDWDATLAMIMAVMERGDHLHHPELRSRMRTGGVSHAPRRPSAKIA